MGYVVGTCVLFKKSVIEVEKFVFLSLRFMICFLEHLLPIDRLKAVIAGVSSSLS